MLVSVEQVGILRTGGLLIPKYLPQQVCEAWLVRGKNT
ncbi:hypothetical protein COO91_06906 [Nostoc flagelliforme CCNUN1]|uniref:Uncharacterized protein n=1 Tax=Nostoc flagelliforme CCNUN1 TaxID=2038116 RepID=A0A2K8SZL0_9NOSO|nr:hypothetical protein COO91_06906 [Nostoc flagelliforme CCNUN1]